MSLLYAKICKRGRCMLVSHNAISHFMIRSEHTENAYPRVAAQIHLRLIHSFTQLVVCIVNIFHTIAAALARVLASNIQTCLLPCLPRKRLAHVHSSLLRQGRKGLCLLRIALSGACLRMHSKAVLQRLSALCRAPPALIHACTHALTCTNSMRLRLGACIQPPSAPTCCCTRAARARLLPWGRPGRCSRVLLPAAVLRHTRGPAWQWRRRCCWCVWWQWHGW